LFYILITIAVFSTLAYFVQQRIVHFLLRPSHNQQFIYTSPGGGISFLFQICTYVGIIVALPVILYQLMRFLEPVISTKTTKLVFKASVVSFGLAAAGFIFGYYVGLPTALHFLGDQFQTKQIHALFTIQEYMSFLTIYLGGSALLFQLPLIVWFIDKIKPRGPRIFLKYERHVIAGSFIIAMLMAPVPNLIYQALIALPIIIMYQIAIGIVWFEHRPGSAASIASLRLKDKEVMEQRLQIAQNAKLLRPVSRPETTVSQVNNIINRKSVDRLALVQ
jgi:sec-independent protein translocase protein TatC